LAIGGCVTAIDPLAVVANVAAVRRVIAERTDRPVRLVAVTKGFAADAVRAAIAAGADAIGENYAQELTHKVLELGPGVPWHFIGQLQRNKVRGIAGFGIRLWETIDRDSLAREVAKHAPGAAVLVQVNTTEEPQKGGCAPAMARELMAVCGGAGLNVEGLMTVGPLGDPERTRTAFRLLRQVADDLGLAECSMGMSADYEIAIDEGATIIRIGSRLFGPRPSSAGNLGGR
jgi:pyridoxal phosphate enzyme (YggS family)